MSQSLNLALLNGLVCSTVQIHYLQTYDVFFFGKLKETTANTAKILAVHKQFIFSKTAQTFESGTSLKPFLQNQAHIIPSVLSERGNHIKKLIRK